MGGHTPGQWTVAHAGFERLPCVVARRAGRPVTVSTMGSGAREEDEANARLIAAAPDLLAFANDMARHGLTGDEAGGGYDMDQVVLQARAVISKATATP